MNGTKERFFVTLQQILNKQNFAMKELALKYGCNPNQKPSRIYMEDGSELPLEVINGRPGYINFLDALNSWQFVKGAEGCYRHSSCSKFQTRFSCRSSHWSSTERHT